MSHDESDVGLVGTNHARQGCATQGPLHEPRQEASDL